MTAKEYLSQIKMCRDAIERKRKQCERMRKHMTYLRGISYDRDKIQTSPKDSLSETVVAIVQLEQDVEAAIFRYEFLVDRCINMIEGMSKRDHMRVLYARYVDEKDFETIACEMHLSYYRVCHIHGEALQEFSKKFPEIEKMTKVSKR